MKQRILTVDEAEDILDLVEYNLVREGFGVILATNGEEALRLAHSALPDLILLDLMLPGINGFEIIKRLKSDTQTEHIPVILLTVISSDTDIALGLELGADDYITKPFSPHVLVARVKAVLRRKGGLSLRQDAPLKAGDLVIDPGRHEISIKGRPVQLTITEFRLLHLLVSKPGWVLTRNQIIDSVRGANYAVTDRSVDVHIAILRKKLGSYGKLIETVRGAGYRFKSPDLRSPPPGIDS